VDDTLVDLAAVDILRTRECGVPGTTSSRRKFNLAPATRFEDFSDDAQVVEDLGRIYDQPDDVDLMVGLLRREGHPRASPSATPPSGSSPHGVPRLKSDRFFHLRLPAEVYTPEGMRWIADNP